MLVGAGQNWCILHPWHHLTGARKVEHGLVNHLFAFVDKDGKPMLTEDESKEMILFEPVRLFRFMVEVFDPKEKALRGEVAFTIIGDVVAAYTGGNEGGQ